MGKTKRTIERPINKLYPVEFQDEFNEPYDVNNDSLCQRRNAAVIADLKRKFCC